ncbi:glycosyl hydrolase family 30 TIM-barrel domain-containing protein [Ditylenchus destructor]|nr:glycosyl hydrolase family 30 TIM-barrel domain-containing protein [Ditylenchus destructor]
MMRFKYQLTLGMMPMILIFIVHLILCAAANDCDDGDDYDCENSVMEQYAGCAQRVFNNSADIVCVCNSTYCDTFPSLGQLYDKQSAVYISSKSGKRFEKSMLEFSNQTGTNNNKLDVSVTINVSQTFQTIIGFGGAFTDAVGINLNSLTSDTRKRLIEAYYGNNGIEYSLGRVPMASCDFSTHAYSYCDTEDDFNLTSFALADEDFKFKIPYIKEAMRLAQNMSLFASPWSAPGWMKETGKMVGGGKLKGDFNGKYYETWANYFIRFFEEYYKQGIDFWGVTLENEPSVGVFHNFKWQAMFFNAVMQRDFVAKHLGPTLRNSTVTQKLKLMVNDDQRYLLPSHPDIILGHENASQYIDGIAVHWYADFLFSADRLSTTHDRHPAKFILPTEACNGYIPLINGPILGDWHRGESYGEDIIEDLQNWAIGWTDWNICLDLTGGPNFAKNLVDSPIIVNATSDEFYKQPMFYVMGHFSKFIRPGSVRLGLDIKTNLRWFEKSHLTGTVFLNPDQKVVLVLQNRHNSNNYSIHIPSHRKNFNGSVSFSLEADSIATIVWNV